MNFTGSVLTEGGVAYFFAQLNSGTGNMGYDLWRSDGTVAGTRQYANIDTQHPQQDLVYFNGRPYFTHSYSVIPESRQEIWTSDGTAGGTTAVTTGTAKCFRIAGQCGAPVLHVAAGRFQFRSLGQQWHACRHATAA